MPESDADRWEDLLAAEVARKIQEIPIAERHRRLLPAHVYASELAAENPASGDGVTPEHARLVVAERATPKLFRDMFDPQRPVSTRWVLNQATEIAWQHLRKKRGVYKRYSGELPDPNEAIGYAYDALVALSARIKDPDPGLEEVRNPYGWLWESITGRINQNITRNILKHREPWMQKHYSLVLKFRKRLETDDPSKDKDEIEEEAVRLADAALERLLQMLYRVEFEQAEALAGEIDFSDLVHSRLMLDLIEDLLQKQPFTKIDCETWALWRAVDFVGRDIDWEAVGVKSSTGAQRLHALVRKLRKLLSDLGYDA
jgi:hypothetical protein